MKKIYFIVLFGTLTLFAQSNLTLDDFLKTRKFAPNYLWGLTSMKDGKHYTTQNGNVIEKYDYLTGTKVGSFDLNGSLAGFESYEFSADETKILLSYETKHIYRYSSKAKYKVYDISTKKTIELPFHNGIQNPAINSTNDKVAYVADNNIYYYDLKAEKETQVTSDGEMTKIINGASDWVYEEEFAIVSCFQWSPDGSKIAYLRFDESEVPLFEMAMYQGNLYPQDYEFKYPKVGEQNSKVTSHIYDLKTNMARKVDIKIPYEYIPRFRWNGNNDVLIYTMNRLQNELKILKINATTLSQTIFFEENASCYLEINDFLQFLSDGSFLWVSEKDGYNHIYLYDKNGKQVRQITKGKFEVTNVFGVNEKSKILYYESTEVSPLERHLYSITLDGKKKVKLTTKTGTNRVEFTSNFQYYVCTHSSFTKPVSITLHDTKGKQLREMLNNNNLEKTTKDYSFTTPELFSFKNSTGEDLNGYMIKPKNFDPNKKYPLFMFVYGGPGSQQVLNQWGGRNQNWFQMLAQEGYIIACVDNRGTGGRGRDFRTCTYKQLGKLEVDDQIDAAKYLGGLPYIDNARIGIFGWSYGGYMTSLCITRGADVFKLAIAVAPVTNWKFYDSIYTERYMGTKESNPTGYDANAPMAYADKLKGSYLLIHGTADDNVHWQNSAEHINALVKANKQFELFIYPDRNHGISGGNTTYHLYTMMTSFIRRKL